MSVKSEVSSIDIDTIKMVLRTMEAMADVVGVKGWGEENDSIVRVR